MELLVIRPDGSITGLTLQVPQGIEAVIPMCRALYEQVGFHLPWVCYCAVEHGQVVGTCAFKSPPSGGRVELAYFTLPPHEGRGVATRMAAELIRIAREGEPAVVIVAQTLPQEGPSVTVLKKLGFTLRGAVQHPEDGPVWEWQLPTSRPGA